MTVFPAGFPYLKNKVVLWMIRQYFISTWRWVALRCSVLCWISRLLSKAGGKRQVTGRAVSEEAALMRRESDAPDFLE
jgi:hypothetical protein